MAFLQRQNMPETSIDAPPRANSVPEAQSSAFSKRSLRQLSLFFGGALFLTYAQVITRKSLVRRYKSVVPKFYQPSNRPNADVNGAVEAYEALTIATVNVLSASMMLTGGALWAFDISSLDDMRRKIRGGLGMDGEGREKAAEEEMEEWLATVLARKDEKEKRKKDTKEKGQ